MKSHYDVYMCREGNKIDDYEMSFKAMVKEAMERGGYGDSSPVVNEWIEAYWRRKVRQMKNRPKAV